MFVYYCICIRCGTLNNLYFSVINETGGEFGGSGGGGIGFVVVFTNKRFIMGNTARLHISLS